jgi:hypothetical protein
MYARYDDACPLCRAKRINASVRGHRPPRPVPDEASLVAREMVDELMNNSIGGALITPGGTIFFPVDNGDGGGFDGPRLAIMRRSAEGASGEEGGGNVSSASSASNSVVAQILNDPVFQAAQEGLRNPGQINIATFVHTVRSARDTREIARDFARRLAARERVSTQR